MKQYKSRDKITQKMTRDGLIEVNETQQTAERISKREQDADFQKSPEQQAAQDGTQLQGVASPISPLPHAPGAAPQGTPPPQSASWSISKQRRPAKPVKKRYARHRRKPPHKQHLPACSLPRKNLPPRNWNAILKNQTKPLTNWTRQRQLSQSKRNWLGAHL